MYNNELNRRDIINIKRYTTRELSRAEMESLTRNIYLSISEELKSAAYYQELSDAAPDSFDQDMILEFSEDEREHAYELQQAYNAITGQTYVPPGEIEYDFKIENYLEEREKMILSEAAEFKKYKEYYLMTNNDVLKNIFFDIMQDKAYHAIRKHYLIHRDISRRVIMEDKQDIQEDIMVEMKEMMGNILKMMGTMMDMMREMKKNTNQIKTNTINNKKQ